MMVEWGFGDLGIGDLAQSPIPNPQKIEFPSLNISYFFIHYNMKILKNPYLNYILNKNRLNFSLFK
jgi:hypothetical protein